MFTRSTIEPCPADTSFAGAANYASARKITLTETCDIGNCDWNAEAAPERRFALLVFCENDAQIQFFDEGVTAVIGREPPCDIVVRDPSISRRHVRFEMTDGQVWVEDLDSRNGTFFGGRRIHRERLDGTCEVAVGRARVVVVTSRAAERSVPGVVGTGNADGHVVNNACMKRLYEDTVRAARSNLPVLVLGETGVGKEHVATTLHRECDRRDGPFVVINCAAIAPSLLEATLFGHDDGRGAGSRNERAGAFERANGGTLFLDEIGELAAGAQAAVLRAIDTRLVSRLGSSEEVAIDVRIVAATHCDLAAMVQDGTFRQDLYFRLNGVRLEVPPLRERTDEIDALVDVFVDGARRQWGAGARGVSDEAMDALRRYSWPGNVRQLRHAVERAALLCRQDTIEISDIPDYVLDGTPPRNQRPSAVRGLSDFGLREQVSKFERALIDEALRHVAGNRRAAAKLLRIPVRTLFRKMRGSGASARTEPSEHRGNAQEA